MEDIQKKLRRTPGTAIRKVNSPADHAKTVGALPKDATVAKGITRDHGFIHLFVKNQAEQKKEFPQAVKALAPIGLLWISFPKEGAAYRPI